MSIATTIESNVARVRDEIAAACLRAGRAVEDVTLIGVTKSVDRAVADALIAAGVRDIAENRVQDALAKFGRRGAHPPLPDDVRLHMIGNLQTNKARDVIDLFGTIHSVNRIALADALQREAARRGVYRDVLLEVNTAGDAAKQGVDLADAFDFHGYVIQQCTHLRLIGLMTIAEQTDNPEDARSAFRALRELRDALRSRKPDHDLPVLSMGMSNDFPIAIEEGATHIRVGRALLVGLPSPT